MNGPPTRKPLTEKLPFASVVDVAVVPEDEMVDALVEWATFINENGTDAAIARADTARAEREANKDRSALLEEKGDDANNSTEKIVEIRRTVG